MHLFEGNHDYRDRDNIYLQALKFIFKEIDNMAEGRVLLGYVHTKNVFGQ